MSENKQRGAVGSTVHNVPLPFLAQISPRWFLHAPGAFQTLTLSYSMCPLCYLKQQTVWKEICHLQLFTEGYGSQSAAEVETGKGTPFKTAQRLVSPFTTVENSSNRANSVWSCLGTSRMLCKTGVYAFYALLGTDGGTNACDYTFHRAHWYACLCLSKNGKERTMWSTLPSNHVESNVFLGGESLKAKIITFKRFQIYYCEMKDISVIWCKL